MSARWICVPSSLPEGWWGSLRHRALLYRKEIMEKVVPELVTLLGNNAYETRDRSDVQDMLLAGRPKWSKGDLRHGELAVDPFTEEEALELVCLFVWVVYECAGLTEPAPRKHAPKQPKCLYTGILLTNFLPTERSSQWHIEQGATGTGLEKINRRGETALSAPTLCVLESEGDPDCILDVCSFSEDIHGYGRLFSITLMDVLLLLDEVPEVVVNAEEVFYQVERMHAAGSDRAVREMRREVGARILA